MERANLNKLIYISYLSDNTTYQNEHYSPELRVNMAGEQLSKPVMHCSFRHIKVLRYTNKYLYSFIQTIQLKMYATSLTLSINFKI